MYQPVSPREVVDDVEHIYGLCQNPADFADESSGAQYARMLFLRRLINNLKHERSGLSPRILAELSRHVPLSIGGSFRLVGYQLDAMREADFLLNGHRTRIIESYPFHLDREIDLPRVLSERDVLERNAFISEVVLEWQKGLPIRVTHKPGWHLRGTFYVQLGTEDSLALSGVPPGAILTVVPISADEQVQPNPKAVYCLQFGNGYRCCSCIVSHGRLTLLPKSGNYQGSYEFLYPQEVRIVGRVQGFAVSLPPLLKDVVEMRQSHATAPLILPWEQPSLDALLRTERLRFGLTEQALETANEILGSLVGVNLSPRTLRRYAHEIKTVPHTATLLGLTMFHSARISDVLKTLHFWQDESRHYSLKTLLRTKALKDLSGNIRTAITPEPYDRWEMLLGEWGEWPTLLSMAIPNMEKYRHRLLRIQQNELFDGLDPMIRPGAVALLEEGDEIPDTRWDREQQDWYRPVYAIRHAQGILCGHLDNDGQHLALIPHPRSSARRISFLHRQVQMMGRFLGVASPFQTGH